MLNLYKDRTACQRCCFPLDKFIQSVSIDVIKKAQDETIKNGFVRVSTIKKWAGLVPFPKDEYRRVVEIRSEGEDGWLRLVVDHDCQKTGWKCPFADLFIKEVL